MSNITFPLPIRGGSLDFRGMTCSYETLFSLRSKWYDNEEHCHQKLPFDLWIHMNAKGSANNTDADHVENECLIPIDIGAVEINIPEDWDTIIMDDAPGKLLRKSDRAATYLVESPRDFEAMCDDDQVTKVSRITASSEKNHGFPPRKSERRPKNSVSEAAVVHGVPALISGLEELGCQRTTGEAQTLCIMSDSFNTLGGMLGLQESGDLPPDEFLTIVEELPSEFGTGLDEGMASA